MVKSRLQANTVHFTATVSKIIPGIGMSAYARSVMVFADDTFLSTIEISRCHSSILSASKHLCYANASTLIEAFKYLLFIKVVLLLARALFVIGNLRLIMNWQLFQTSDC